MITTVALATFTVLASGFLTMMLLRWLSLPVDGRPDRSGLIFFVMGLVAVLGVGIFVVTGGGA